MLQLQRVRFADLGSRQQENYNYHKISALLADYGFTTLRLSDDWHGADFIAQHIDGKTFLKVQLKGRFTLAKKYAGRDVHVAFPSGNDWYLFPHDAVMDLLKSSSMFETESWVQGGEYSSGKPSKKLREILEPFRVPGVG